MSDDNINHNVIISGLMAICKQQPQNWQALADLAKSLRRSYINIEGKQDVYRQFNEIYLGARVCAVEKREDDFSSKSTTHAAIIKAAHIGKVVECFVSCANALTETLLVSPIAALDSAAVANAQDDANFDIYDECVAKLGLLQQRSILPPRPKTMVEITVEEAGFVPSHIRQIIHHVLRSAAGKSFAL